MNKQPLLVHLVFHPKSEKGREMARHIHGQLNDDVVMPGLRIPTVFCSVGEKGEPPAELSLGLAEREFVVVLAEDHMVIDEDWCRFVGDVWEQCEAASVRFVPFQLTSPAWPLDDRLDGVNFGRAVMDDEDGAQGAFVVRRIVVELCRYLSDLNLGTDEESKAPVKLFLSHTKMDLGRDPQVTKALLDSLGQDQPIAAWVDSGAIQTGSKFADSIKAGISETSLLAVLTDHYMTREWCREEILLAKEHDRPVVVIDALSNYESRSFPYLGNVPTVRWDGDPQKGIDLLLKETLRQLHVAAILDGVKLDGDKVFTRPPELATLVGLPSGSTVLYPDPPLGVGEAKRLLRANIPFVTPLERVADDRTLDGKAIALSMSESTDIERVGMDSAHLERCMLDVSRYLLIKGATLAYGGHLGAEGYTQKLFELISSHNGLEGVEPFERIVNFRGWPLPRLSIPQMAEAKSYSKTVELPRPDDVDESLHADFLAEPAFFPAKSPEHRFAWARGMTEMRAYQAEKAKSGVVARIVIGGTFGPTVKVDEDGSKMEKWYMSRIPGVLEEVMESIRFKQPVFLVGAFGGVGKLVIDLLRGIDRPEVSWDYQKGAPFAPEMKELYEKRGVEWVGYQEMISQIREAGPKGINPLLSVEDQSELYDTVDSSRMIELILKGLNEL